MRKTVVLALVAIIVLLVSGVAPAQSDSGEIHIVVTDAATKAPIDLARVLLDGAVMASELTSKNGQVVFTDVPDGIYRARIVKRGYSSLTSASFEVLGGRVVTVSVALVEQTNGLKIIGSVSVKASAAISSTSINQDSAQRKLSDDLAGALNKLSGVSVDTSSDDSDATQTISLEGHDPSQTQLTLDGIPLNAPGQAGNLRGFASDLFMGSSVHMGPSLGGLGGSVNFTTLQPTLSWLSQASITGATYGRYNYSFAESGSIGKLGLAVQNVYRSVPSLADGDLFLDASGQDYVHDGDASYSGNLLKLRYQFSDSQTLTGTFLNSARDTQLVCLRQYSVPALPCGYGPGSTSDSSVQLYSLTDNALIGATQLQASVYSSTSTNLYDALDRTVAVLAPYSSSDPTVPEAIVPSPAPIGYSSLGKTQGFMLNATLPAKEKHTFSIQALGSSSTQSTTPLVPEAVPFYNGSTQTSYEQLQLSDTIHSNDKLSLLEAVGLSGATGGGGASILASSGLTWRPTNVDTYAVSYALGGVAATAGRSTILTDPASLRFDCNGNVAYGSAPGDEPGRSSSTSARASYTRTLKKGSVSFQFYRQVQNGVLLPIYVNGTALAPGTLPFGYLAQVRQLYDSPAGCNQTAGTPFALNQLYYTTPIANMQRVYQGGSITGYVTLGNLVVQPYYDVNVAEAIGDNPFLFKKYAITISGNQLPNVPLQRAGVVFDYKAPHSIFEWMADAQHVSSNNQNDLPAYTTFDAGVSATLTTGTLTFAASNITNAYGGVFAGPENAVPYTTYGGILVGTTARPLAPRTYSATYSLKFGQGATSSQTGAAFNLPRGVQGGGPGGGPEGGPGGRGPGGGGFRNLLAPLPATPPPDPLAVVANSERCTGDAQTNAQKLSGEIKAFVAQIEAAKTSAGYPATMAAPALADASFTYHGMGDTYAVTIVPRSGGMRSMFGCFALHVARPDDVAQRKLYAPANVGFFVPQITFMPSVGLYVTPRPPQAGQEQFRVYKLPTAAPADPFAVRTSATCAAQAQSLAQQSLTELRAHFANGAPAPTWTITAHDGTKGTWYQLDPSDPTVVAAIVTCARVAATAQDELATRGFGGAGIPSLNYAAPLGLYIVRPRLPTP
ncbi:MAG TPA: TonB-dependent receptor [Candidatus Baltobacteraceae bacterium]|nr:TonB-dependent receptor [Candidatus Baltobacteraceae bacterium]